MGRIVNIGGTEIKDHGIQVLVDYVKKNFPDEYTLVLGCKPYTSDVDGVLIGRGSIFAIEVKDWKGKIKARSYGLWERDGKPVENPLSQARNNAVSLAKWLRNRIGQVRLSEALGSPGKLWVRGLLVFTNPKCSIDGTGLDRTSNTGVNILSLDHVKDFVTENKGDEQVGEMVKETFGTLDADIRNLVRIKNRKGGAAVLAFASVGILICAAYLIWSNSPDKTIAFVPLGIFVIFAMAAVIAIVRPADTRGIPAIPKDYKQRQFGFPASSDSFDMSNYGQSNAVLTNYLMDFDRDNEQHSTSPSALP
jgi:hypothetical protein